MSKISVLITDDSPTMRSVIKSVLRQDTDLEVVGEAADPYEAREKIKLLRPDVLILDIEMPKMSGLEFLKKIMTLRPMPVVMLSGLTKKGASDTIEALQIGAFECLEKPTSGDFFKELAHLPSILKAAARYSPVKRAVGSPDECPKSNRDYQPDNSIVAIGSSTGGVEALMQVLTQFHTNCPPTIITQHMPEAFLATFAERLNKAIAPIALLAENGTVLKKGHVYLAPGGDTHLEIQGRTQLRCHLKCAPPVSGHIPSVDVMFASLAKSAGKKAVGVILTGMGRDGAKGLLTMRNTGSRTLGQSKETCVVYGMPRVAHEIGATQRELPLAKIGGQIMEMCRLQSN